jgi:hypothetical protein
MLGAEHDQEPDNPERRGHERSVILHPGALHNSEGAIDCVIKDISASGARLAVQRRIPDEDRFVLDIDGLGLFPSRIIWQHGDHAGIQFLSDPSTVQSWINAAWRRPTVRA